MTGGRSRELEAVQARMLTTLGEKVDPSHTALVVVDVQNDFCAPGGMFDREGINVRLMHAMFPALIRFIDQGRQSKVLIVYIQSIYSTPSQAYLSDVWLEHFSRVAKGRFIEYPGLEEGAWGSDFCAGFQPLPGDVVVRKHRYSAFLDTDLDLILRSRGIRTLLMAGVATNVCVEMTARIGFMKDYYIVLLKDCTAATSEELHNIAVRSIETHYGVAVDSAEVVRCWQQRPVS